MLDSAVTMKNSSLTNNKAGQSGGAAYLNTSTSTCALRAENCTFNGNSAENNGGAIYTNYDGELLLANCTFSGNSAVTEGGAGGAIANPPEGFKIYNTLFAGNRASRGNDIYAPNQGELVNCRFDADGVEADSVVTSRAVSYTHLDVYKSQTQGQASSSLGGKTPKSQPPRRGGL